MNDRNHMRPSRWAVDRMNEEMEPGKVTPTTTDETRKRLWVDVFYQGVREIHRSVTPDKSALEASHRADLVVAEYDKRFGA